MQWIYVYTSICIHGYVCFITKIDWLCPEAQQADKIVNGTANLYLNGDKARKLPQHRWPVLCGGFGSNKEYGKVLRRKKSEPVRLPFLI